MMMGDGCHNDESRGLGRPDRYEHDEGVVVVMRDSIYFKLSKEDLIWRSVDVDIDVDVDVGDA